MNFEKILKEAKSDYEIYHNSLTNAVAEVEAYAEKNGYELDDEEMAQKIGFGPAKPSGGKTNRYSLSLMKNGKEQKKMLHFQVYNREAKDKTFELNLYVR